jgi:hypothetical protein
MGRPYSLSGFRIEISAMFRPNCRVVSGIRIRLPKSPESVQRCGCHHGDTLTLSVTLGDGTPLPTWLTFEANTRTLCWAVWVTISTSSTTRAMQTHFHVTYTQISNSIP